MREFEPTPDPSGALQPPNRYPPTAVGTETPEPDPVPRASAPRARRGSFLQTVLKAALVVPVLVIGAIVHPFGRRHGRRRRS